MNDLVAEVHSPFFYLKFARALPGIAPQPITLGKRSANLMPSLGKFYLLTDLYGTTPPRKDFDQLLCVEITVQGYKVCISYLLRHLPLDPS